MLFLFAVCDWMGKGVEAPYPVRVFAGHVHTAVGRPSFISIVHLATTSIIHSWQSHSLVHRHPIIVVATVAVVLN